MRCVALSSLVFLVVAACGTTKSRSDELPFVKPNELMGMEIQNRIAQIPYQHREELFNSLLWLVQRGEQAIPSLLDGLSHDEPKVRSNCAWVLGQIRDRRVIPSLRPMVRDSSESVRYEVARSLVALGDVQFAPVLIEGLDSDKVQVRYLCHEALKNATLRDFQYDHLGDDRVARSQAVYRWRTWWAQQSGDQFFASSYAERHGIDPNGLATGPAPIDGVPAAPNGETAIPNAPIPGTPDGAQGGAQGQAGAGSTGSTGDDDPDIQVSRPVPQSGTRAGNGATSTSGR